MNIHDRLPGRADLDEAARPEAPRISDATDFHRHRGRRLRLIHETHLGHLAEVRHIVGRMEADVNASSELVTALDQMAMARNLRQFGTLCGNQCGHLQAHHDIEENHSFPIVEMQGGHGLRAVIAKLRAEHEVVHALIKALVQRATAFHRAPDMETLAAVREALDHMEAVLRSHFGYEEEALEEALGYYGGV